MIFSEESVRWALLLVFSSVLSIYLSGYALQRRDVPGAKAFAFYTLTIALYSLGYALEINAQSLELILEFMRYEVFWASFTAPAFLLFVISFIRQKKGSYLPGLLIFILPLIIGFVIFSEKHLDLMYKSCVLLEGGDFPVVEFESGFWHRTQLIFLVACSTLAELLLLVHLFRVKGRLRVQTFLVLLGGVFPTGSAIANPERSSITHLDTQPFFFFITILFLALALFRFRMLDLSHIARNLAVDKVRDSLLILDRHLVVRDINAMGRSSELLSDFRVGRSLEKTDGGFARCLRESDSFSASVDGSRVLSYESGERHYRFSVSTILEKGDRVDGWLVHIRDDSSTFQRMKRLENQAEKDDLTGISNRRFLMSRIMEMAADTDGRPFALILFDLDHFKAVNDNYGHPMGDRVLVRVTDEVGKQLRSSEVFGRYGGEEFCILCPDTDGMAAFAIAERLRQSVEALRFESEDDVVRITASFGVCEFAPGEGRTVPIESMIERVDIALYTAKEQGRNRTVLCPLQAHKAV